MWYTTEPIARAINAASVSFATGFAGGGSVPASSALGCFLFGVQICANCGSGRNGCTEHAHLVFLLERPRIGTIQDIIIPIGI